MDLIQPSADAVIERHAVHQHDRETTTDREHRASPRGLRFLNAAPRPPAHRSGPRGAR